MKDLVTGDTANPFAQHYQPLLQYSHCFIAYSGGLDSTVLLHSISRYFADATLASKDDKPLVNPQVTAIHVNHQLHTDSDQWQQHCLSQCQQLSIPLIAERVLLELDGNGIESAARDARYKVFEQQLAALSSGSASVCLLMAHHANDQAETVLMRLSRGAGTGGAAGIPQSRPLANADLIRPLLSFTRSELEQYAKDHQLKYINDPSNSDERFDRNFIRRQVLPIWEQRWPAVVNHLERFANIASSDKQLLSELAAMDLASLDLSAEPFGESIAIDSFNAFSAHRKTNILRFWLMQKKRHSPSQAVLNEIEALIIANSSEAKILLDNTRLSVFRNRLYLLDNTRLTQALGHFKSRRPWQLDQSLLIDGLGCLSAEFVAAKECGLLQGDYTVGVRQEGQKYRYHDMSRSIKKCFNEQAIPPWLRDFYPLVYSGDTVAAIPGVLICDGFRAATQEQAWQLRWQWLDK